jgi:hypothetical protein
VIESDHCGEEEDGRRRGVLKCGEPPVGSRSLSEPKHVHNHGADGSIVVPSVLKRSVGVFLFVMATCLLDDLSSERGDGP